MLDTEEQRVTWVETHYSCRAARPLRWLSGVDPLGPMCLACIRWAEAGGDVPPIRRREGPSYFAITVL